jgi:N-6 DNA methylase
MLARVPVGPTLLMTMTDIAELADVQRPVVTTWRRRYADFPAPAGGGESQPLFEPRDIADWLLATGRISRELADQELSLFTLTGLAARYDGPDVIAAVTALLCVRFLAGESEPLSDGAGDPVAAARTLARTIDPNDRMVLTEIRAIPLIAGWLIRQVDDLVEASWTCQAAFERVMAARHRFGGGPLSAGAVTPALARLIAELSGAAERGRRDVQVRVADPAAGHGDLLAAVASVLGPDHPPVIAAAEANPALARLLRRRLLVHGVAEHDLDVRTGTELPDGPAAPDVIVTQVPYQPGEARDVEAVFNMVDDAAVRLSAGRFGVVLGPASVLVGDFPPYSAEERARADLLAGDMVEAVIRLPGGMVPFRPGYETALWVLTQARDSRWRGRVLMADISDRELTHQVISDLVEDVTTWRRDGYVPGGHSRVFGQQVAVRDLIDPPRPLTISSRPASPREHSEDAARRVALVTQRGADLDRIGATATADRPHVPAELLAAVDLFAPVELRPRAETVGALVKGKILSLHQGTRIKPEHITPAGHHVVLGPDEVLGIRRPGERKVDRALFARTHPAGRLTAPGDVLVTTVPRPGVMVDTRGYAIAEFPVRILRIPAAEAERFTPAVLAALLFADGSGPRVAGAIRPGRSLEDQRVIALPPDQVRSLDRLLGEIGARRDLARRELEVLGELQDAAIGGLIDGTLTVIPDDQTGQDE